MRKSMFTLEPGAGQQHIVQEQRPSFVQRVQPHMQKNYKFAMKVHVSNHPENLNKDHLVAFLYQTLDRANGLLEPGNPIASSNYNPQSRFLFINLRSIEETDQLFKLDGIFYRKKSLKFSRPNDYEAETKVRRIEGSRILPKMDLSKIKICRASTTFQNNFNKLFFTNIPLEFEQENIYDMLMKFGNLRAFLIVTDKQTNRSKGFGYCQYDTDFATENCIKGLNGQMLGTHKIVVKKAILVSAAEQTTGIISNSNLHLSRFDDQMVNNPNMMSVEAKKSAFQKDNQSYYALLDINNFFKNLKISCVLQLRNIIPLSVDPEIIKKDLLSQLQRVGKILKTVHKGQNVWIEYERVQYSQIAYLLLLNHKYDGKYVEVSFYDPISFADNLY